MTFPLYIDLLGLRLHPHLLFETLAYSAGFQLYLRTRGRWGYPAIPFEKNLWIVAACILGALAGSKLLNILEMPLEYWEHKGELLYWIEGKTIVGGLLGGWLGVEIAKKKLGITYATGDAYVFPLILGTIVGRIGCFLSGLEDKTYGTATMLPWGIDFGDGISRHPTQLYEIAFMLLLAGMLALRMRRPYPNGYLFRLFMLAYLLFRFVVEFFKPRYAPLVLSTIQIASLAGAIYSAWLLAETNALKPEPSEVSHG